MSKETRIMLSYSLAVLLTYIASAAFMQGYYFVALAGFGLAGLLWRKVWRLDA